MKKILCTLPNASELIGGIQFESHPAKRGMISVHAVDDSEAIRLASIPGFEIVEVAAPEAKPKEPIKVAVSDEKIAVEPADQKAKPATKKK